MKVDFPPKLTGETRNYQWDFTGSLALGETVITATVTAAVWSGNDATPSALISGSAAVASPLVTQLVTGGVAGTIYKLVCAAVTSAGQTIDGYGLLAVLGDYK